MSNMGLVPVQVLSFLWSIAVGAGLGLLFDIFRIARIAFPGPPPIVVVQDVLFGLLAAIVSFGYLLAIADGRLRFFLLLGEAIGWALYYATIGDMVMALSNFIIDLIRRICAFIWRIIAAVARVLHRIFVRPVLALYRLFIRGIRRLADHLKVRVKRLGSRIRARTASFKRPKEAKKAKNGLKKRIKAKYILQTKA